MAFDYTGRPPDETKILQTTVYHARQITPDIGIGLDDVDYLEMAAQTIAAAGGGVLKLPRTVRIGSDWEHPRSVILAGEGSQTTQVRSFDGAQHYIAITGQPADAPGWNGDQYAVVGVGFDKVGLIFGPGATDHPRGSIAVLCQFVNSDFGLKVEGQNHTAHAQVGAMLCKFRLMSYGIRFHHAGPHHIVSHCDISECSEAAILVDGMQSDGVSLWIETGYSDHVRRFLKIVGPVTDGGIYVRQWGVEWCGLGPGDVPFADGYAIEMEGGQVWLDQFQMFNTPSTTAQFWVKGGVLFDTGGGRRYWDNNGYCRIDGGTIVVDQSKIFSPGRLWGENQAPFAHPSSIGGKVVAPRSGYIGRVMSGAGTILSTGSPTYTQRLAEARDGNIRVIEFELLVTNISSGNNSVRVQLGDGATVPSVDLNFPLLTGLARVQVVHVPGVTWNVSATYHPNAANPNLNTAAGSTPTKAEFDVAINRINLMKNSAFSGSVSDPGLFGVARFLLVSTVSSSGSPATMILQNLTEVITGPPMTGL